MPIGYGSLKEIFHNEDGTYTVFVSDGIGYSCNGIGVGWPLGFSRMLIYNLDSFGNIIFETSFPDNCVLGLHSIKRLSENRFLAIARYSEPNFMVPPAPPAYFEERIYIMDGQGNIERLEVTSYVEKFDAASLRLADDGSFKILYRTDSTFKIREYNSELSLVEEIESESLVNSCYFAEGVESVSSIWNEDGSLTQLCHRIREDVDNTFFIRFDENLNIFDQDVYTMNSPSRIITGPDEDIYCTSYYDEGDGEGILITRFSLEGDSLDTELFPLDRMVEPRDLYYHELNNEFLITGAVDCCNFPEEIGPGKTFVYQANSSISNLSNSDNEQGLGLRLSPNPFNSQLKIQLESPEAVANYFVAEIYQISGQNLYVKENATNGSVLELSWLPAGVYVVRIELENGLVAVQRIFKTD